MAKHYTLFWSVQKEPPGGVSISADVPPAWTESLDPMGEPTFRTDLVRAGVSLMLSTAEGDSEAARLEHVYLRQFQVPDAPLPPKEALPDGSLWVVNQFDDGATEARRLIAAAPDKGVVMCIVRLRSEERGQLEALKKFCMSVQVAKLPSVSVCESRRNSSIELLYLRNPPR